MSQTPGAPTNPTPAPAPVVDPKDQEIATLKTQVKSLMDQMGPVAEYVEKTSVILNAMNSDPAIVQQVKDKITPPQTPAPQTPPATPPAPTTPPQAPAEPQKDPTVVELEMVKRDEIIKSVEQKYGYDKLPAEERKALRQKVEAHLNRYGQSVMTSPVTALTNYLDDAYLLQSIPDAGTKPDGYVDNLIAARNNEMGAMPSISNNAGTKTETTLTEEQKKWANKMNVPLDKVQANLEEFNKTGQVTYKPKEEVVPQAQPTPSGTPTPPATQ